MPISGPAQNFPITTAIALIAPEELLSRKVRLGFDYWRMLCGTRCFPARGDVNPREIAGILTNMALLKVIDGGSDFRYRIVGDHAGRGYRADLNGRSIREVAAEMPRAAENWLRLYRQVTESGKPMAVRVSVGHDAREVNFTKAEAVFLPLGETEDRVDHLICFVEHELNA